MQQTLTDTLAHWNMCISGGLWFLFLGSSLTINTTMLLYNSLGSLLVYDVGSLIKLMGNLSTTSWKRKKIMYQWEIFKYYMNIWYKFNKKVKLIMSREYYTKNILLNFLIKFINSKVIHWTDSTNIKSNEWNLYNVPCVKNVYMIYVGCSVSNNTVFIQKTDYRHYSHGLSRSHHGTNMIFVPPFFPLFKCTWKSRF